MRPDDRPRVLMLKSEIGNDREVTVTVEDTGIGFDPANSAIFLKRSSQQRLKAWEWVCRYATRSCVLMAGACRRRPERSMEPSFASLAGNRGDR